MSKEISEVVNDFNKQNGNQNFSIKELIIYFNKKHESDIEDLKEMLDKLPCWKHNTRITRIETTNKLLAGAVSVILTIFGLIIAFLK